MKYTDIPNHSFKNGTSMSNQSHNKTNTHDQSYNKISQTIFMATKQCIQ